MITLCGLFGVGVFVDLVYWFAILVDLIGLGGCFVLFTLGCFY